MRPNLRQVLTLLSPHRKALIRVVVLGAVIQLLSMLAPFCEQLLIDKVYRARDISLVNTLVGTALAVTTAALLVRAARQCANALLSVPMHLDMSVTFYKHVQHLPVLFFESQRPGELAGRFEDLSSALRSWLAFVQAAATNIVFILALPPVLFRTNSTLALIGIVALPLIVVITYKQSTASYRYAKRERHLVGQVRSVRLDTLNHVRWMKGLSLEQYCERSVHDATRRLADLQCSMHRTNRSYAILIALARAASVGACTWLGWRFIIEGALTLGQFVAFMSYLVYLYNPVSEMVVSFSALQQSIVTFERIAECLSQSPEEDIWRQSSSRFGTKQTVVPSDIRCEDVAFSYSPSVAVLEGVNVLFQRGMVSAVIGPSGCGKTTLLRLLLGFHRPGAGRISMGGADITHLELSELRSHMSVVWQDSGLLSGSLWDNLTLDQAGVSRARVNQVIEICQLDKFIASQPNGFATRIGAEGVTLSAGQKQRLAIAQALLRDTPILLLDEATANIDFETERKLLQALFVDIRDKLVVFVTHRNSAALLADRVFECREHNIVDITRQFRGDARKHKVGEFASTIAPQVSLVSLDGESRPAGQVSLKLGC